MSRSEIENPAVVLTIAGIDPSGGAGVLADVRTFAAFGCYATAAITSLTFQNTTGVFGAINQSAAIVRAQVTPIIEDFTIAAAKTGMLPTREVIVEVARLFRTTGLPAPVVDPVMRATSGDDLIDDGAVGSLITDLLPLARLVTPNIPEAERLTGLSISTEDAMRQAAQLIRKMGAPAVLVKGGHLFSNRAKAKVLNQNQLEAVDILDEDGRVTVLRGELIPGGEFHGSGCVLSAAIAAGLGKGMNLEDSVRSAKQFVTEAMRRTPNLGRGTRPVLVNCE